MSGTAGLVRPLTRITARDVAIAGGKGANLGELVSAGFPVPSGFVVTTDAYALAASGLDTRDPASARARVREAAVPETVAAAVRDAYRALGGGPVAVRSSATAEDLPEASFAGQQDTVLGVVGADALLDALRQCWASLWNERAVAYRATHDVDPHSLGLAVVVQRMVDARAAGVLFTADPLTGRRQRASIEAVSGLGDRLVSGAVNPEHYVVDTPSGAIPDRGGRLLDDDRLRELARLGARIESHFGRPQDIEWALDDLRLWIVQSRDITTLYPLPPGLPDPNAELRVLLSANVAQGVFQPFTPMGLQTFRLLGSGFATHFARRPPADIEQGISATKESGMRLWLDFTPLLTNRATRDLPARALSVMEARSEVIMHRILDDPRLRPSGRSRLGATLAAMRAVFRTGVPFIVARTLARPDATRVSILADLDAIVGTDVGPTTTSLERIAAFERLLVDVPARFGPRLIAMAGSGFISYNLAGRLLGKRVTQPELRTVLRSLPFNPTTEMDLGLWEIARTTQGDPAAEERALVAFLERYGHRAVAEIDLGLPRWSEDPTHLRNAIAGYRRLADGAVAPDAQFARGAREADAMIETLVARTHGPRRFLVRALLRRVRALSGLREMPKFQIMRIFARGRRILAPVGEELAAAGRIARADDLWFLRMSEVRRGLAGEDLRGLVAERRAEYAREMRRRHVPRVLLSDGTDAEAAFAAPRAGGLRGTPASPGVASGTARVLRSPEGAQLEPGEVLVAPATDPGWTPLFLTASALVMEMGGMMSHGAVVAREYGIPAVVGLAGATERIATGQRVSVDGSAGTVTIEPETPA
jgi:phosphohistidine swiveling domain-containing protein